MSWKFAEVEQRFITFWISEGFLYFFELAIQMYVQDASQRQIIKIEENSNKQEESIK